MNQQNVEAIAAVIARYVRTYGYIDLGGHDDDVESCTPLARFLAREGVLVPSILTDDQANKLAASNHYLVGGDEAENAKEIRAEMEQIAKGEPQ